VKALVGLGNPGPEYDMTRHNVGFLALDQAASLLGINSFRRQFKGLVAEGRYCSGRVVLFKPTTYMNLSGEAMVEIMHWYKLEPAQILIFSDDIDLLPGMMRLREKGGAGTHNGWRSILQMTGSQDFPRARIGVGAPPRGWELRDWVLSRWDKDESSHDIRDAIQLAAKAGVSFLEQNIQITMNQFNILSRPKKQKAETVEDVSGESNAEHHS
jgi:PTH1 family peptidyl-tRNA hydrolase